MDVRPDQVSVGVLVTSVPRDAIDGAVARCGVGAKRSDGKLPPHVTAYLTMGLWLFPEDDYTEVAAKVTGSLDRFGCWDASWTAPTSGGISQARQRLGRDTLAEVFEQVVEPVGSMLTRGAMLRSWRVLAIDGFEVDVPDTKANAAEFGYAGSGDNRSAYPKARVVALTECGTHAFLAAQVGAWATGEKTLAMPLYSRLRRGELLTADRNFYSWQAWDRACATGADLLWRAPTGLGLPVVTVLADGTYLTVLVNPSVRGARRERILAAARAAELGDCDDAVDERGLPVAHLARVVEYDVPDRDGNGSGELIALLSTVLDPGAARADELAEAYHLRWEHETGNDQLKTHLRGPGKILRSRLPDLVHQEIWAWLLVHYAMSVLITRAAEAADIDPDRISFTRALRLVRRTATGTAAIPPSGLE
ncbi:IS4 family transposase [Micromonospora sp. PPF5-17]|uniref:IS4 family transposase n=1 Tax=Micromonospora solifontis TaxID=2487138 RepID=A0ABX9W7W4_9ACTN|nr:IS4 family transposase [Micromonospora sp. PPF5-17B]NES39856.1 IS4 family transposase [Micromonospora solifontis]NES59212.1 IS4 family transposase [Micromonospora sp. PPF5-6]RNL83693.1 IS4 family transposase [Micromonospora solifontis]